MTVYLIDGYNLIHRFLPEVLAREGLERAREELEVRLDAFQRLEGGGARIVLVYDGERGLPGGRRRGGLDVVFTRPPASADDAILEYCRRLEGRETVCVVTSDLQDIGYRIGGLRVRHLLSEEFARRLARAFRRARGDPLETREEKPRTGGRDEVEGWLRDFDLLPEEE